MPSILLELLLSQPAVGPDPPAVGLIHKRETDRRKATRLVRARAPRAPRAYWVKKILGTGARATYLQTHADLTSRRREIDMKINEASGQRFLRDVPRDPDELKAAYESGACEWRRAFIESLVEKIIIGPGVRGLNKFDHTRVKIK